MIIYLIGYMGCGKSTAGRLLAEKLGYSFVDLDFELEKNEGRTISQIFEQEGQDAFRKIEQRELHATFNFKNTVVATGGGAPCFFDNMYQMNKHGKTVYIQLSASDLCDRLRLAKNERPIIANKTDEELLSFIESALNERDKFYTQAQKCIEGIGITAEIIIKELGL